ncbi:bifunctional 5,10-methylenetetrahydrofolate dehydrogenase/5,10-methenyltetrahydrofolate cyclohydrolase [Mycoplasmopsis agassizii]|uniref:Bifunctional protein FolD n=1 Tax=Mycoplasmopsis agassizii TaxID=33922 RepID=A0ABX4H485_9BACT|nr:bifunctional 5,10-methylenetetrahydrofolate dehydrogenase/5,10-methenyltetrahydrofolate cyclohydrolase [Mycoplasmopsis agassizii]PAF54683.1 hypothetical protein CJF60_03010 [Mycoplasmopsis agassizii]SMC16060.1 methylenetetrahydrofolate dehydrogenase (NADP+) / methenyltetrahydrofolate cyclohydrolase [Mycoplasmopsis agassizii]
MDKLFGKDLALNIKENLKIEFSKLNKKATLKIILIGDNPASITYINYKMLFAKEVGVDAELIRYSEEHDEELIINDIHNLNKISDSIIVQLPLPDKFNTEKILDAVDYKKDVDGLSTLSQKYLLNDHQEFYLKPATAMAVIKFMDHHKLDYINQSVGIIGQSRLIGYPLKIIISRLNKNLKTYDIETTLANSETHDLLIVATGVPGLIKAHNVKKDATLIDVGFSKIDNKIYGDIDEESVSSKAKFLAPALGSIGPVTVAMLFENILIAALNNLKK